MLFLIKKPIKTEEATEGIDAVIGHGKTGRGEVKITAFEAYGHIILDKPVYARTSLEIELERTAQVRNTDAGPGNTGADIDKRTPPCTRGEIVAKMRRHSGNPRCLRFELQAAE